ncbi:MAG: VanW family protein [Chitinophagaceae bacterium]
MGVRNIVARLLPQVWKLQWKLWCRNRSDRIQRLDFAASKTDSQVAATHQFFLQEQQPIRPGAALQNKLINLRLGAAGVHHVIIQANQVFSFWKLIGNPSKKNGFAKSRSIVNGKLEPETGGGLCQLSGIIYLLALRAGLSIIERHHHSIDIYQEAERFTPLGADATVAYGYKDLRFINNLSQSIYFSFLVEPTKLSANLHSCEPVPMRLISFTYDFKDEMVAVQTLADGVPISVRQYRRNVL